MVNSPFNPRSSSLNDLLISLVNQFILSHSWKATTTYGVLSSTLPMISIMLKASGSFSMMSSTKALILSSLVVTGPLPVPLSLGCSSKTVLNKVSDVAVKNPISALGCNPYKMGLSGGKLSVMYLNNI